MTPSYETNAPRGYMGDPSRGAALGRAPVGDLRTSAELLRDFQYNATRARLARAQKENRPGDGWKAIYWRTAAAHYFGEACKLNRLHKAAKVREASYTPKVTLQRIRLDNGGYDPQGAYWGTGAPLYWAATDDGEYERTFRASDRDEAKEIVREKIPHARFFR